MDSEQTQGSKLTVARSNFATSKPHLPPVENVSKILLSGNYVNKGYLLGELVNFHGNKN